MNGDAQVPVRRRIAYAAPAFSLAVVGIPLYVYIPKFYTDVVGVPVAAAGIVLAAVRVFDAVTDPMIGVLSDRTSWRMGRRRPWIVGFSVPLALSIGLLFVPPETSGGWATAWFALAIFAVFLFWTAVTVPYESLGLELSTHYDERTALLGLRDGVLLIGTVAALVSTAVVAGLFDLGDDAAGERAKFRALAFFYGPVLVASCVWCAVALSERGSTSVGPRLSLRALGSNRPFAILLTAYTVSALGSNLPAALIPYYVEYVLGAGRVEVFLLLYFVVGIALLPLWIALSRRIGKRETWIGSMLVNTGAFIGVFFLGPGDVVAYGVLVTLSGVGLGGTLALPSSMQADVIDYDELRSGRRREGLYIGVWSVTRKVAAALGVGLALTALGAAGYQPNVEQTPQVQTTLRALYALVPSLCNVIAIGIAWAYPLSREAHARVVTALEHRRAGSSVDDPLRPGLLIEAT